MIKKFLLPILLFCLSLNSFSQVQVGDWRLNSVFSGENIQNVIDTGNMVFYLSDGYLFSYNKAEDETVYYNKRNDMSDLNISKIYYNYDKKYLFVVYENSNIDLVFENGNVINIPDLKNTVITGSKKINTVDFSYNNEVYVATDFGFMIIDDEKYIIKQSFNYGKAFTSLIANDKYLYACFDKAIWFSEKTENHFGISSFKKTDKAVDVNLQKINDKYAVTTKGWFYVVELNYKDNPVSLVFRADIKEQVKVVSKSKSGYIASFSKYYVNLDENGNHTAESKINYPADMFVNIKVTSMENDGSVWALDKKGLKHIKINDDQTITYLMENYRPNVSSVSYPFYLKYEGDRLYAMSSGKNNFSYDQWIPFELSYNKGGQWKDLAPESAPLTNSNSKNKLNSPYGLSVDPDNPERVWFGTSWEGIFCVENNQVIQKFDNTNSPMIMNYICLVPDMKFDKDKNLWFIFDNELVSNIPLLYMLPASKRLDPNVTREDWIGFNIDNFLIVAQGRMHITKNGTILVANNNYKTNLFALDHNNTPTVKDDDRQITIGSYIDQDNKSYDISYFYAFAEEPNGKLWIATNNGVCYLNNPDNIFGSNFYFNRVKVPRNDGTNLADYLLDGLSVTCIAIDGANRKWFGTSTSGVYLVSEDGTEIIDHFTMENSYLPSDAVYSIACDANSNMVYIGTSNGMAEYSSDAVPAESNMENVYAYPNPVRPDYTGDIIIRGLMDNSWVKITDSVGNIVYQTCSNGGMVVWNGCNMNGKRVDTGVYFVMASQSQNDSKTGCVTKILVVR